MVTTNGTGVMASPSLFLGAWKPIDGAGDGGMARMPAHHLVTHSVIVGMTTTVT